MFKTIAAIILALLILVGGVFVYQQVRGLRSSMDSLRETDAIAQATIQRLTVHVDQLQEENKVLEARDAASEVEKAELRKDRDKAQAKADQAIAELQTAPPERLLTVTRSYLNTSEVYLRLNAAQQTEGVFSLDAFRLNAQALEKFHYYEFSLIPSLQTEILEQTGQLQTVRTEVSNLKKIVVDKDGIIGGKDGQITERDKALQSLRKSKLVSNLKSAGIGAAIGAALVVIFGK
ncbi:MAG: hypothetical protein WC455_19245 [Dehalococcoidia bacterium]|jgi:hypothetical protein